MEPIEIERIACGTGNCFIVSQGGSAILVDTAGNLHRKKVLKQCQAKNIRLIVLTHGHYDHAQNAAWLAKELNVPIAMHPADLPLLSDMLPEPMYGIDWISHLLIGTLKLSRRPGLRWLSFVLNTRTPPFEPAVALSDGFSLAEYGVDATVIELPGHTRGSVGIVAGDGLLAGDALTNLFAPSKAALWVDKDAMEQSAEKASAYGTGVTVHFGHGKSVANKEHW